MTLFFDTNVLVYCTDSAAPFKQQRARQLVTQASLDGNAWISTQVLIELFNVLTRKQKIPATLARNLALSYCAWSVVDSDVTLVGAAMETSTRQHLSIWDAMVIEAARRSGASTLYTEDLTHGQRFGAMTVVNPFFG